MPDERAQMAFELILEAQHNLARNELLALHLIEAQKRRATLEQFAAITERGLNFKAKN